MTEQIEVEIKYTPDDYVRGTFFIQNRIPFNKYSFVIFPVILFVSLLAVFVIFPEEKQTLSTVLTILIPCLFVSLIFLIFRFFPNPIFKWNISRQFKSSPAFQETQHICFDEDGIKGQSNLGSGKTKWEAVIEAVESKEDFFFYTGKKFAQFVPKRCFSNIEQQNQLRELVKRKLGDRAKF